MFFKQFYLESLGHASYLIGSEKTAEALVLDVRRDVDVYLEAAQTRGLKLVYAADTHQHNDYLTGICELPRRADVQLLASARAELGYPARPLGDGERFELGEILFEVLSTPGHTPEHMSFLIRDRARGDDPVLLLSGGALLVGDVARPDLLGGAEATREAAAALCRTLQEKILGLPDHVLVFPTHVSGSLCGGHIGSMLCTTIGYERRMNRLLASLSERQRAAKREALKGGSAKHEFVEQCLDVSGLPAIPPYWRRMRHQNQQGPEPLGVLREPPALQVAEFERALANGALVLDCRSPEAFGGGHIPGALNVGAGRSFATWAGTVLPEGARVLLVLESPRELWDVTWQLLRTGYDLPLGWLAGAMTAWRTQAKPLVSLPQWTVWDLKQELAAAPRPAVLDVRQPSEWQSGHIPDALHIPGGELPARLDEVPRGRPLAVTCGSGYRSSVSASLLQRHGFKPLFNVLGGMAAWKSAGFPMVTDIRPPARSPLNEAG